MELIVDEKRIRYLSSLKEGDIFIRLFSGVIPMEMRVTSITNDEIISGPWKFHRITDGRYDEDPEILVQELIYLID